jgi:zinc protease
MKKPVLPVLFALLVLALPLFADPTEVPGLYHYKLDNGLELFVLENHSTPLAYIEIAIRGGGIAQTAETAGLFHFYEHMMFKGNSKFRTAAEVTSAYLDLGVPSWNGSTGSEYVNYYFTVPSDKLRKGLEFWSYAIREPIMDPKEIETEKSVVISEITGDFSDPQGIYSAAIDKRLFPRYPWRRDPAGTVENVKAVTAEKLRAIQKAYYIPNNAALFVGGDVKADEVFALVKDIYGSWERGLDPWAKPLEPQAQIPFRRPTFVVYPDPTVNPRFGMVQIYYRGPDVGRDPASTYAADVWGFLIDNPSGKFKKNLVATNLGIPAPNYTGGYYWTQKDGGQIIFWSYLLAKPGQSFAQRAQQLKEKLRGTELTNMTRDRTYFTDEEYTLVKQLIEDQRIQELETVEGFLGTLRFWWASASTDYFFSYIDNMKKVSYRDISAFLERYIHKNLEIVALRVNPSVYEAEKKDFENAGFETISADNAFWWEK